MTIIREKVIPVLWLLLAAIIIGGSIGVNARADECPCPYAGNSIDVPELNGTP